MNKDSMMDDTYKHQIKSINDWATTHMCNCIGPQKGDPVCPCRMRNLVQRNGRWVEVIDHGPIKQTQE